LKKMTGGRRKESISRSARRDAFAAPRGQRRSDQTPIAVATAIAAAVSNTPMARPFQFVVRLMEHPPPPDAVASARDHRL
jgi:hypothetical protein